MVKWEPHAFVTEEQVKMIQAKEWLTVFGNSGQHLIRSISDGYVCHYFLK
jgi:hypothetical protein